MHQSPSTRSSTASGTRHTPSQNGTADAAEIVGIRPEPLSSEEREDHIRDCTRLMEEAYERYEKDGNFADRGDADRWMRMRDEAVRGRSAEQVARMEQWRGLSGR